LNLLILFQQGHTKHFHVLNSYGFSLLIISSLFFLSIHLQMIFPLYFQIWGFGLGYLLSLCLGMPQCAPGLFFCSLRNCLIRKRSLSILHLVRFFLLLRLRETLCDDSRIQFYFHLSKEYSLFCKDSQVFFPKNRN
jgi:hypothetical protein